MIALKVTMMRFAVPAALLLLTAACNGEAQPGPAAAATPAECAVRDGQPSPFLNRGLQRVPLEVHSGDRVHRFTVEVAASEADQERGLMCRTEMGANEGMLFPFPTARPASFWMRNTLIPLDIIFIRADGTIQSVGRGEPLSLENVTSGGEPVDAVLELNAGRAAALGIRAGDRVSWQVGR